MKYLLDTNVLVQLLRRRGAASILGRLDAVAEDDVVVCSVVRMELVAGAIRSHHAEKNLDLVRELLENFDSLPFDDAAADCAGRIRAGLEKDGATIGPNDLLIAGIALSRDLKLVTHNQNEFSRIPGLIVEDWEQSI